MNQIRIQDKRKISRAIILDVLAERDPVEIRSKHIGDYERPAVMTKEKTPNKYVPDLTMYFNDDMHIYEIEVNREDPDIDKWKVFDAFARVNNGQLFLVVPDINKQRVQKLLESEKLNARVLYFDAI